MQNSQAQCIEIFITDQVTTLSAESLDFFHQWIFQVFWGFFLIFSLMMHFKTI